MTLSLVQQSILRDAIQSVKRPTSLDEAYELLYEQVALMINLDAIRQQYEIGKDAIVLLRALYDRQLDKELLTYYEDHI